MVHYTFSTLTSAFYGAFAARLPKARLVNGFIFGEILWAGLHEVTLPLLGGTPPLNELPSGEQVNEFVSHAMFGLTVESVRAKVSEYL